MPTDCPQRERRGWSGDAQISSDVGEPTDCRTLLSPIQRFVELPQVPTLGGADSGLEL